jgi:hypothetical protein
VRGQRTVDSMPLKMFEIIPRRRVFHVIPLGREKSHLLKNVSES